MTDKPNGVKWTDICIVILTAGIVAAAIMQTRIFNKQWSEMHNAGAQTDRIISAAQKIESDLETANAQNLKALKQTLAQSQAATDASNKQSQKVLNANIAASQLDERAWLAAGNYTYTIAETGPIEGSVMVVNTGKTPAMDVLCRITGTTKVKGDVLVDSDIVYAPSLITIKQGTIFPNQNFPLHAGGTPMEPEKQKIWFANVQNGEWIQYFFGEVRYKDAFGRDHWTHFCTQFVPATKSGTPCSTYNDTDDRHDGKRTTGAISIHPLIWPSVHTASV